MTIDIQIAEIDPRGNAEKIKNFDGLLDQIESLSDKKKQLWKEIYQNALADRQNSYAMFATLVKIAQDKSTEHAVHGKTISTYISCMSKSNEQLIKLADLIAKADSSSKDLSPDEIFMKINQD